MKKVFLILSVLVSMCCMSFTSVSYNDSDIDYSRLTLLEHRTIMPRDGRSYMGYINYRGSSFPIFIFWDTNFEYHNLYAYIAGSSSVAGTSSYAHLYHYATYDSESTEHKYWFVIKCDYTLAYDFGATEDLYVAFRVTFEPSTQILTYEVIEEGQGTWSAVDREVY